ncbi:hypothetical protein BDV93DRAFT_520103, partial [Ceratobasidium sp. AG-I]
YASGYWISLFDEARARGVNLDDQFALDDLWSDICYNILSKSVLTGDQLLIRERHGKHVQDGYDWGMIVVLGYGIDKEMKECLTPKEVEEVEAAMKEVVKVPKQDTPRWYRVRRLL